MVPLTYAVAGAIALNLTGASHSFLSIVYAILGISALIFVHELGHFLACKVTGTRVETFAIGFGPRLFGWEREKGGKRRFTLGARKTDPAAGAMDFRIAAIPLGGYVKMAGEIGGDGSATSGLAPAREPLPDEFPGKSIPQRFLIAVAGVVMNVIAAIVCLSVAYGAGYEDAPAVVGDVIPGGPAWSAGVQPGDVLSTYGGQRLRTFYDLRQEVILAPRGEEEALEVVRGGQPVTFRVAPAVEPTSGLQGLQIYPAAVLTVRDAGGEVRFGATTPGRVHGRRVVGGAAAYAALELASLGHLTSVEVEGPDGRKVIVSLRREGTEATSGPFKLGVGPWTPPVVSAVRGTARAAGLAVGDVLVAADDAPLRGRADLWARDRVATLTVRRAGAAVALPLALADGQAVASFVDDFATGAPTGGSPAKDAAVRVNPAGFELPGGESPAAKAGVLPGDEVLAIAGKKITSWDELLAAGRTLDGSPVDVEVRTGDAAPRTVRVTPRRMVERAPGAAANVERSEALAVVPVDGAADAIGLGLKRTVSEVRNVFRTIARFFTGDISFSKNVSGPVTIATISSSAASKGLSAFLVFLAFISVNLAVLNVLPIPVLDGGTMMFLIVEAIRGKRLSDEAIGRMQLAGFALLMLLMVFALKNDVTNLFGG
ncbi:MAG: RIP metalloprotease RseP [Planctomycetota bacterium]